MKTAHAEIKTITYHTYNPKDESILSKLRCIDLRQIARENYIKISGKKADLIERISKHFIKSKKSQIIQTIYRGSIVRYSKHLSGPALYNRKICINDTDFVSMENISDVAWYDFFSYKDSDDTIYGFSLLSFVKYISSSNRNVCNPYNRNPIEYNTIKNAIDLFQINKSIVGRSKYNITDIRVRLPNPYINYHLSYLYYHPQLYYNIRATPQVRHIYNKMIEYRHLTLNQRIQNIFIEFDRLGNYTQSQWFTGLTLHCYPKFLRILKDIWRFRADISSETKHKICSIYDPFQLILTSNIDSITQNQQDYSCSISHIKLVCVTSMETLIYTGIDEEHCKLGSLYCLMALTRVCHSARITMPWLYDAY